MPERPGPSYTGEQPFFFVSYGHADSELVFPEMRWLQEAGVNLWYDEGIHVGSVWRKAIADALSASAGMVFFVTRTSVESDHCLRELSFALDEGKPVFVAQLDDTRLTGPLRLSLADRQMLNRAEFDEKTYRAKLTQALNAVTVGHAAGADAAAAPTAPLQLPSKPSLAVMPFANLSNDPEQDYFADGMMEEVVAALTRFKSLFVIASGSTLSFKGRAVAPQDVARQLGVRYVLEGSVRKAGERVRIAVKLIDASDGAQIWADRFDDTLADVFALQDRVALSVAGVIEPTIQASEIRRAVRRPSDNAYDLYLRALHAMNSLAKDALPAALDLAERAVALDPDFAPALMAAAFCRQALIFYGWTDDPAADQRRIFELADHALKVAGDDATILAYCAGAEGARNLQRARAMMDQAIALNPGAAPVWFISGADHTLSGEPDAAIEDFARALRLDPSSRNSSDANAFLASALFEKAQFSESLALNKELDGRHVSQWAIMAAACGHLGRIGEGRAALVRYRAATAVPLETAATAYFRRPEHQKLFLDGIALVEEGAPSAAGG